MEDVKAVIVRCGNEEYAIPVEMVVSIERLEHINPVPHLPDYLLGLMHIRGELVPILDMERILYSRTAVGEEDVRVVVVQTNTTFVGLLVLEAKEIIDLPSTSMNTPEMIVYSRTPYFRTVASVENRMIIIIDPTILVDQLTGMDEIETYIKGQTKSS